MKKSRKRIFIVTLFLLAITIVLTVMFRSAYLEKLEIGEQYVSVFWTNFKYKTISLVITFIFIFASIYVTNKRISSGLKNFFDDEKKPVPKLPNKSISFIIASLVSLFTSNLTMNKLILFVNSTSFEIKDRIFNHDVGYYIFQKPFLEYVVWFGIITVVALTVYAGIYYIVALNTQFDGVKSETLKKSKIIKQLLNNAKVLSILIAILTFMKTQDLSTSKFLIIGDKSTYSLYGAGLADISIKLWGYRLLSLIIVASVFMAISAYNNGKTKKVIGSILTVPIYLCLLLVTLVGYNAIFVNSNELDKQKNFINYNIESTRKSYNVEIDEVLVNNGGALENEDVIENADLLLNSVVIVNKDLVLQNLNGTLTNKGYYTYQSSQVGQYNINGKESLVYVSPREVVNNENSYINSTYEYTHGYGAITTAVSSTSATGNLENYQKGFTDNDMNITQPRIYFGTQTDDTIVTNSAEKQEFDYPISDGKNETNVYDGLAGLNLGFLDRLILAISQGDTKLAFSSEIKSDSKILINRNIIKRAKKIMPYLIYDENPYMVVTDEGKLVWVLDAYTTSNYYPYAQKTTVDNKEINYIRNSVKVIIDAYDGTTKFYITDRTDPIIMAYWKAYDNLFVDLEESIPEDISKHFVYPKYLYDIQSDILKRYHNVQADVLYRTDDVWDVPAYSLAGNSNNAVAQIQSYYTMVKTVENDENRLGLVMPYTISGKQNITSYLVGSYENGNADLKLYIFPDDSNVLGLLQLDTQIEQNDEIYKQIASLNVSGTKLTKNIVVVPVDNKLLYVEAIYQQYINEDSALPTLKKIVVASGTKVAIGDNLKSALTDLVSQNAIGIEIQNTDDVDGLIELIIKANKNLEQSTENGDWEMVGKDMERLQRLIEQLEKVYAEEKERKQNETTRENGNSTTKDGTKSDSSSRGVENSKDLKVDAKDEEVLNENEDIKTNGNQHKVL
ncbi:MAG: UPF0182 family protein [Clostridia bacterium]|nr:UPF0182 family protein [Clostridia bacterium]